MNLITYLSLVLTTFLWGGTFIAGRALADTVQPASASFLRFFIASVTLIAVLKLSREQLLLPPKATWLQLFLLGLTGVFGYNVFFFNGLHYISAGRASLFVACTPLVITFFAAIFQGEKLSLLKFTGFFLSLIGAVTVISNGHPSLLFTGGFGPGEKALIGCVLSWAAYSLIGRSVLTILSPLIAVCYSSIIGTLLLLIPAARENLLDHLGAISLLDWTSLCYLGTCGTALGFSLYYQGIKKIGATKAGIFINLVPLFALLLSWLILDEVVKPIVFAGGMLVLTGISLANYHNSAA